MNVDEIRGYPKTLALDGGDIRLRSMRAADRDAVTVFARALPAHDQLFREGRTHDLVILSHDVSKFRAQLDAHGVGDALER
jgi:hypothetical protein